jgi:Flp pilus assembly protein TadG
MEFAIIIPALSLILLGIIDFGMFMNQRMKLQELAASAAQYVVQKGSDADVEANVIEISDFYVASTAAGQTIGIDTGTDCECANGVGALTCSSTCPTTGDYLRHFFYARLTSTYTPIFPYPGIPATMDLEGYARMQYNPP